MSPLASDIEKIRKDFKEMQSKEDLLKLLNFAKPFVFGSKVFPFKLQQLTRYSNPKLGTNTYEEFKVKKKSGAFRSIHAPTKKLKVLQQTLGFILQCVFEPHPAATGFVKEKSIVDNAKVHLSTNYVFNMDLKDFFPSVDQARIWKCLQLPPFNLVDKGETPDMSFLKGATTNVQMFVTEYGEKIFYRFKDLHLVLINDNKGEFDTYSSRLWTEAKPMKEDENGPHGVSTELSELEKHLIVVRDAKKYILSDENIISLGKLRPSRRRIANMIAAICCTEMNVERLVEDGTLQYLKKNVLPQGAPTSPVITNIICYKLDRRLSGVAKRFGLRYTRYADDITFSSMHNVYQNGSEFREEVARVISDQGFVINPQKTRLQKRGYRQEVTGLLVNKGVNVQQRYVKDIRMWLYYLERYGSVKTNTMFAGHYLSKKINHKNKVPDITLVLAGKLDFLKMVKGTNDPVYEKLQSKFTKLVGSKNSIETVLEAWKTDGIEKAMVIFYSNHRDNVEGKI